MQLETNKKNSLGLATVGLVTIKKEILHSSDFLEGKAGDPQAADRIIAQVWSNKKTDQLRDFLTGDSIFLTMPSTTGTNIIPIQLAQFLTDKAGIPWAVGDEIFNAKHTTASKNISRDKRIFNAREFEIRDTESVTILQKYQVIIIDDIITSGGSIRNFTEFLRDQKITVSHVVGCMGDRRFEIDRKTEEKLKNLLAEKIPAIKYESINYITRTEAGGLIRLLNSARSKNAIQKLTKNLHGIQRFGVVKNPQRVTGVRDNSTGKKDNSDARTGERIQAYTSASSIKEIEWEIRFLRGEKLLKTEKVILSSGNRNQLKKLARKVVSKENFGIVQVKFTKTGKTYTKLQKEKSKNLER